jgi:hypothetical protein
VALAFEFPLFNNNITITAIPVDTVTVCCIFSRLDSVQIYQ